MDKIYEFFGIAKPRSMTDNWNSRMGSSVGNSNSVYDRYAPETGLHGEARKDLKSV